MTVHIEPMKEEIFKIMCIEERGQPMLYVTYNGLRIAKCNHYPNTPYTPNWIGLEPGWVVRNTESGITIKYPNWMQQRPVGEKLVTHIIHDGLTHTSQSVVKADDKGSYWTVNMPVH